MTNPVGRPSKYNDDLQAMADSYITEFKEFGDVVPQLAGLACFIGITRETLYQWMKQHPKFSDTAKAVTIMQERMLVNGGLSKVNDAGVTKMLLASNHGYSDKTQTELTGANGGPIKGLNVSFVDSASE